jgi:histidinol-phosphatase (PHP family)
MTLPADAHVHSEWSWDTGGPDSDAGGRMRRTCERAVRIGLPALVLTEHLDVEDAWRVAGPDDLLPHHRRLIDDDGYVRVPPLRVDEYLEAVDRCRHAFPDLRILTGVEFGQPHLRGAAAARLLDLGALDRVNGSLHTLANGADRSEPNTLFRLWAPDRVLEAYLEEIPRMVAGSDAFAVVTHLDYAVRSWPSATAGPFDPKRFEEPFRTALRAIAASGRALELNTRRLWPWLPQWWSEEGGRAVTFGSDAHEPEELASWFPEAAAMAEHFGFRPGSRPEDFWTR